MKKSELKQIIKEEIKAVLVNTKADHYMFFENLKIIKNGVEELMKMDKDKIEALLSNGHDWANDHIATSKDDVEEVHNFFKTKMSSMNEKMLSDKQKKIASAAPPADKITGADFKALRKLNENNENIADFLNNHKEEAFSKLFDYFWKEENPDATVNDVANWEMIDDPEAGYSATSSDDYSYGVYARFEPFPYDFEPDNGPFITEIGGRKIHYFDFNF
jgi:hypothetical protein